MDGRLPQDSHRLMARRTNETAVLVNGWQPHSDVPTIRAGRAPSFSRFTSNRND
jgi:hypothetical protein